MSPSPFASVADALIPAALLLACRYPLLLWLFAGTRRGERRRGVAFVALWLARVAAMLAILPALRLIWLGGQGGTLDTAVLGAGVAILSLGAAAFLADDLLVGALRNLHRFPGRRSARTR